MKAAIARLSIRDRGPGVAQGPSRRLMYIENKNGAIDGYAARIGWVTFSRSARTVYYRDLSLTRMKGGGVRGNYMDARTGDEYWISGVKKTGTNVHWAKAIAVHVDDDAVEAYRHQRAPRRN